MREWDSPMLPGRWDRKNIRYDLCHERGKHLEPEKQSEVDLPVIRRDNLMLPRTRKSGISLCRLIEEVRQIDITWPNRRWGYQTPEIFWPIRQADDQMWEGTIRRLPHSWDRELSDVAWSVCEWDVQNWPYPSGKKKRKKTEVKLIFLKIAFHTQFSFLLKYNVGDKIDTKGFMKGWYIFP